MFSPHEAARVLVFGHNPDSDLLDLMRLWLPEWSFENQSGAMSSWLDKLWRDPPTSGLVLFLESMESAEIQVVNAWLNHHPGFPVLAVVGGRGLLGAEDLLQHSGCRMLPLPWTVSGLRQVLGIARPPASADSEKKVADLNSDESGWPTSPPRSAENERGRESSIEERKSNETPTDGVSRPNYSHSSGAGFTPCRPASELADRQPDKEQPLPQAKPRAQAKPESRARLLQEPTPLEPAHPIPEQRNGSAMPRTAAFGGEFLDGLVERFRDPLASLSGYLQMLQGADEPDNPFLRPALQAAKEIETALDALYLASDSHPAKVGRISGEHLAIEALKEAQRAGLAVQLDLSEDFLLRTDQDLVRAALQCARALLSLFGGAGNNEFVLHCKRNDDWAVLQWQLAYPIAPDRTGSNPPPPFLSLLLQRFAEKLGAKPVLVTTAHKVPQIVGLAWPAASTLSPVR
jgi:hypothetical protein